MARLSNAEINGLVVRSEHDTARKELVKMFERPRGNIMFKKNMVKIGNIIRFFDKIGFTTGEVQTIDSPTTVTVVDDAGWIHTVCLYESTAISGAISNLDRYMKEHNIAFISRSNASHKTHVSYPGMSSIYQPGEPFYAGANLAKVRSPDSALVIKMPKKRSFMKSGFKAGFNRAYVS